MLEEVGETAAARRLVGGADVVPDVDGDLREAVVLAEDHGQAVGQLVLLELDLGVGGGQHYGQQGDVHGAPLYPPTVGVARRVFE